MPTSIVTGGAGFLGSHLVEVLAKRGESVVVLDNLSTGRLGNLAGPISSGRVTFVYTDVRAEALILSNVLEQAQVGKVDVIYHLAVPPDPSETSMPSLIEVALERNARLVFAYAAEMSGSEDWRLGEAALAEAIRLRGLDARMVRLFNCYGPRMQCPEGHFIPALLEAALKRRPLPIYGTGDQTRFMTYIDDAIELLLLVAARPQAEFFSVDVGNDDERSVLDIAKALASVLSMKFVPEFVPVADPDAQSPRPDLRCARSLGWAPKTSLEKGLRNTHRWFANESQIFV